MNESDREALEAAKNVVLNSLKEPESRHASDEFRRLVAAIAGELGDDIETVAMLTNYGSDPLTGEDCEALISILEQH